MLSKSELKQLIDHSIKVIKSIQTRTPSEWSAAQNSYYGSVYATATHMYNDCKTLPTQKVALLDAAELREVYLVTFDPQTFLNQKVSEVLNAEKNRRTI